MNTEFSDNDSRHSEDQGFPTKGKYKAMLDHESHQTFNACHRRLETTNSICSIIAGLTGCLIALLLLVSISQHKISKAYEHNHNTASIQDEIFGTNSPITKAQIQQTWKGCGNYSSEALGMGCKYDVMLGGWLHSDCHFSPLTEKYIQLGNFTWFRDPLFTEPISLEEVRRGEHDVIWTQKYYHYAHCAYLWELQMRAFRENEPIDDVIFEEEHTVHCSKILLDPESLMTNVTAIYTGFDYCGKPWS